MRAGKAQVRTPAKLNLRLQVTGRRADGYHSLDSLVVPIALFDDLAITIEPSPCAAVALRCYPRGWAPPGAANLATRAAETFLRETNLAASVTIRLVKRIPAGAGLGGGSSDGSAVLRALNALVEEPVALTKLQEWGLSLGADVPFFLLGTPARMQGIGELLEPWSGPAEQDPPLVVAFAGVPLSTRAVYEQLGGLLTNNKRPGSFTRLSFGREESLRSMLYNDLEASAFQIQPAVYSLKQRLIALGAEGALMTGSGSAVFGYWGRWEDAQVAVRKLRATGTWASMTSILRHAPAVRNNKLVGPGNDGRSPSGKAPDFGSGIEGSNPSRPA